MKKTLILTMCIAAALAFAGMVLAQTNPSAGQASSKPPRVNKKKMMGIVESVNPGADTIVLRSMDKHITFSVDAAARILKGGRECQLADIKVDSKATVFYQGRGKKRVAVEIITYVDTPSGRSQTKPEPRPVRE